MGVMGWMGLMWEMGLIRLMRPMQDWQGVAIINGYWSY